MVILRYVRNIIRRTRKTFGVKLSEHQVIRQKIAEMAMRVDAGHAMLEQLAYMFKTNVDNKTMGGQCGLAKVFCSRTLDFCAREAAQIFGGASYTREGKGSVVERIYREAKGYAIYGGAEEILLDLATKQSKL